MPNPSNGVFWIEAIDFKDYSISVIDSKGKKVSNTNIYGNNEFKINLSSMPVGVYFISFQGDNEVINKKIVKI